MAINDIDSKGVANSGHQHFRIGEIITAPNGEVVRVIGIQPLMVGQLDFNIVQVEVLVPSPNKSQEMKN